MVKLILALTSLFFSTQVFGMSLLSANTEPRVYVQRTDEVSVPSSLENALTLRKMHVGQQLVCTSQTFGKKKSYLLDYRTFISLGPDPKAYCTEEQLWYIYRHEK